MPWQTQVRHEWRQQLVSMHTGCRCHTLHLEFETMVSAHARQQTTGGVQIDFVVIPAA
jgi:hypothetical protein